MSGKSVQTIDMSTAPHPFIAWQVAKQKNKETQKSKSRIIEEHLNDVWMMLDKKESIDFHRSIRWSNKPFCLCISSSLNGCNQTLALRLWHRVLLTTKHLKKNSSCLPSLVATIEIGWWRTFNLIFVSFFEALMLINNIIPLFPVSGVTARTPKGLFYSTSSLRYFFNSLLLLLGVVEMILTMRLVIKLGFGVSSSAAILFFIITVFAGFLLKNLARKWPKLMLYWSEKEEIFLKAPYSATKYSPAALMNTTAVFVFMTVFVEHIFFHLKSYQETLLNLEKCNITGKVDVFEHLYRRERGHIADVIPYNIWMLPLIEWQNLAFALSWSYIDVVIVNISIGITTRFKQLNHRVKGFQNLSLSEENWLYLRKQYGSLTDLVFEVNNHISSLILLSSGNNLYFIVVNIFRSFTPRETTVETIHFFLIIFLMIFRTMIMLFATSSINDASKGIVSTLRKVPQKSWNFEVERFIDQIEAQTVALTGKNMFKLTRKLILAFVGTIVTFEIALLDQVKSEESNIDECFVTF